MSDLQEVLKQLSDTLPNITKEMNQLVAQGGDAQQNADELLEEFKKVEGEAETVFSKIEQALAELKTDASEHLNVLNQELKEIEKSVHEVKALEATRDELKSGVEAAGHAMTSFQNKMQEGAQDLKSAHEEFKASLNKVKDGVEEGHHHLEEAHNAVNNATEALHHQMDDAKNNITDLIQNVFHNAMGEQLEETESHVKDFLTKAEQLGEKFDQGAKDILDNVVKAKSHEIMDMAKQKIEEELKQIMDQATDEICNSIQEMVDKVTGSKSNLEEKRNANKPLHQDMDAQKEPQNTALNAVKGMCDTVGINFG